MRFLNSERGFRLCRRDGTRRNRSRQNPGSRYSPTRPTTTATEAAAASEAASSGTVASPAVVAGTPPIAARTVVGRWPPLKRPEPPQVSQRRHHSFPTCCHSHHKPDRRNGNNHQEHHQRLHPLPTLAKPTGKKHRKPPNATNLSERNSQYPRPNPRLPIHSPNGRFRDRRTARPILHPNDFLAALRPLPHMPSPVRDGLHIAPRSTASQPVILRHSNAST